jgi:hypothetical protein
MPIEPPVPDLTLKTILDPLLTLLAEIKERVHGHSHPAAPRILRAIENLMGEIKSLDKRSAS